MHISLSIWLISVGWNMLIAAKHHDCVEYVSSHKTLEAIIKAAMKRWCTQVPQPVGKGDFKRCKNSMAEKMVANGSWVR